MHDPHSRLQVNERNLFFALEAEVLRCAESERWFSVKLAHKIGRRC